MNTTVPLGSPHLGCAIGGPRLLNEQAKRRVDRLRIKPASNRDFVRPDKGDLILLVRELGWRVTYLMRPARLLMSDGFWP